MRTALALAAAILVLSVGVSGSAFGRSSATKLKGTVGPGFTITLTRNGHKVIGLAAGKYAFAISDKSTIHNFTVERESGGAFEKQLTSTAFQGTKTVTVTLKKGKWKYYCSVHESLMHGFFTVR